MTSLLPPRRRWEEKQFQSAMARVIYERALSELAEAEKSEKLYIAFAHFEERYVGRSPVPKRSGGRVMNPRGGCGIGSQGQAHRLSVRGLGVRR